MAWFKAVKRPPEELPAGLTGHFFHKKTTPELPVVANAALAPYVWEYCQLYTESGNLRSDCSIIIPGGNSKSFLVIKQCRTD